MDIFNLQLPEENKNDKSKKSDNWFDFMNDQFKKIEESNQKYKINSLLIDSDIDLID